jgi:NAD(P)-dependent dehydrogenase (short-subunit alcohol dehydrogenase family)
MRLENKVVLLGGVGPHMGRAMALLFAQEGARLALVARKTDVIEATDSEIRHRGGQAVALPADLTASSEVEAAVARTVESFGRLDVFVSLAGGGFRHEKDLTETDEASFDGLWHNHLMSLF